MRLTVVCGCPGADLDSAAAAATAKQSFDWDALSRAWISKAAAQYEHYFDGWALRADRLKTFLKGQKGIVNKDSLSFVNLDRHARPITDAITDFVVGKALDALKTKDVAIRGHFSRDDRHAIIAAFEKAYETKFPQNPMALKIAGQAVELAKQLERLLTRIATSSHVRRRKTPSCRRSSPRPRS